MSGSTVSRTAHKTHRCGSCTRRIDPGARYLRHAEFPGGEFSGYADVVGHPVTSPECARCATRYGRADLLAVSTQGAHDA